MGVRRSIVGLIEVLNWMEACGFSKSELLENTGIQDERLSNVNETVLPKEELQFYRNVLSLSDNPHILMEAGFQLKLQTHGVWGMALISSPTLEKAVDLGLQFVDFSYTYNKVSKFVETEQIGIRITPKEDLGDLTIPMMERDVSVGFMLLKGMIQEERTFDEIHFSSPRQAPLKYFEDLFGCKVLFDQAHTELRMCVSALDHELPQHNPVAVEFCKKQLEALEPRVHLEDDFVDKVHDYLSSTQLYRASMEDCAKSLNMSVRTLRRKLSAQDESYQSVLDGFRLMLAKKYLSSTNMTLEAISERLGYSDAANFSHAFKRWTGAAPRRGH